MHFWDFMQENRLWMALFGRLGLAGARTEGPQYVRLLSRKQSEVVSELRHSNSRSAAYPLIIGSIASVISSLSSGPIFGPSENFSPVHVSCSGACFLSAAIGSGISVKISRS
jgi:hypothetical protein